MMTEFKELQEKLDIKNSACATLFKVTERTIRRWKTGTINAPEAVLMVLRLKVSHE